MIAVLEESDDVRVKAFYARMALWHILGSKQHLMELMGKLEARAENAKVKARIHAHIEATKDARDDNPPLY